ncbi:hypothetical protein RFI_16213, partial [Reticulomyxa filosa]
MSSQPATNNEKGLSPVESKDQKGSSSAPDKPADASVEQKDKDKKEQVASSSAPEEKKAETAPSAVAEPPSQVQAKEESEEEKKKKESEKEKAAIIDRGCIKRPKMISWFHYGPRNQSSLIEYEGSEFVNGSVFVKATAGVGSTAAVTSTFLIKQLNLPLVAVFESPQ